MAITTEQIEKLEKAITIFESKNDYTNAQKMRRSLDAILARMEKKNDTQSAVQNLENKPESEQRPVCNLDNDTINSIDVDSDEDLIKSFFETEIQKRRYVYFFKDGEAARKFGAIIASLRDTLRNWEKSSLKKSKNELPLVAKRGEIREKVSEAGKLIEKYARGEYINLLYLAEYKISDTSLDKKTFTLYFDDIEKKYDLLIPEYH